MAEILIDSFSEVYQSWYLALTNYAGYPRWGGQCFTGKAANISKCKFFLKKVNSPTGYAYAELYAHTGTFGTDGKPTGSPLATSEPFDVETLTTSFALIDFEFATSYAMEEGVKYCIALRMDGGTNIHQIYLGSDNLHSGELHPGTCFNSTNGSTWLNVNNSDVCFYVYGEEGAASQISKIAGVPLANISKVVGVSLANIAKIAGVSNS